MSKGQWEDRYAPLRMKFSHFCQLTCAVVSCPLDSYAPFSTNLPLKSFCISLSFSFFLVWAWKRGGALEALECFVSMQDHPPTICAGNEGLVVSALNASLYLKTKLVLLSLVSVQVFCSLVTFLLVPSNFHLEWNIDPSYEAERPKMR